MHRNRWDNIADRLAEDDFYRKDHRLIYRAIGELSNKGMPYDAVTLGDWFEAQAWPNWSAARAIVIELANSTPSAANIAAYADIVREKSVLRQLIDAGTEIAGDAFLPEGRACQELLETAEQNVFHIAEAGARGARVSSRCATRSRMRSRSCYQRYENQGPLTGLATGFTDLDEMTAGLQPSDLIIVAARPSMGKTALAVNFAENAAMQKQEGGGDLLDGNVGLAARVPPDFLARPHQPAAPAHRRPRRRGMAARDQRDHVAVRSEDLHRRHAGLSPGELRARARRLKREHDLGLIVIDYLQLMQVPGNKENRATEISEISRALKALAKELERARGRACRSSTARSNSAPTSAR